jgi:hypothetical protein
LDGRTGRQVSQLSVDGRSPWTKGSAVEPERHDLHHKAHHHRRGSWRGERHGSGTNAL